MAEEEKTGANPEPEEIPQGQVLFDRIFLWLIVGSAITAILYNGWGLVELFHFVK
ncbi:MAG: hypothetical protein ACE5EY_13585 [Anaerolineae bacterium]